MLYNSEILNEETDSLISIVEKTNKRPTDKSKLIREHYQSFSKFVNTISFENIANYIKE